ncbi:MAG TPA: hypothetical protein VED01_03735 [Burkholderiales bacterium]|nr:hypothetical protein [Burkholderiales bacterium]
MGALAHYLEAAGVATTQISLIREHTEAINPPRALWVPFILGRPLGVPNDAAFQQRVLLAALRLLEAPSGPVLADYPEDAPPVSSDDEAGQACPVSFASQVAESGVRGAIAREVEALAGWYDLAVQRRGRTSVGLASVSMADAAERLVAFTESSELAAIDGLSRSETLKVLIEDLRAFYYEAASAKPGAPDAESIQRWFWFDTAGGRLMLKVEEICARHEDASLKRLAATSIVPRAVSRAVRA